MVRGRREGWREVQAHTAHLRYFQARGPPRGYYLEPTKSILVVAPRNVAWAEEFFRGVGIKVMTGHRYLGVFIGESEAEKRWLSGKVVGCTKSVETIAGVYRKQL